jgi:Predicted metal-dependent RNase, consists of a metallo-beta-lactamase domain and an RNA-binding KH domain
MVVLEDYMRKNEISKVPVYLDGMIWEATAIHAAYPEYLNRDLRERMFKKTDNPFLSDIFVRVDTSETREKIIDDQEPAVILATSGMMNGGPVLEYFMNLADDPKNALLFVGYQAEGTLGRKIQSGVKSVSLPRKGTMVNIDINLQVITVEGFSGHADRKQLIQYITSMSPKPNRIITCHGDNENCEYLAGTFSYKFGFNSISPRNLESIRLY